MQENSKAVANCESPKYSVCEFGKGRPRPNKVNTIKKNPMKEQEIKKYHLLPGHMVSADHYILRAPGRHYQRKVKSDPCDMFSGGCVFIDHASGYVRIKHQVAINAIETIKAKLIYERKAQSQGVVIQGYHTSNGIFNASEFIEEMFKTHQKIRFSGAGASHQNGEADPSIKIIVTMARTMLMYAALICTEDTLSTDIWPIEMYYAVWVYNRIPDMQSGLPAN